MGAVGIECYLRSASGDNFTQTHAIIMPAKFDQFGIRFDYPDNWTVDEIDETSEEQQVVVSSPQTAFWQLSKQPPDLPLEPLFDEALAALRSEYQQIEVETTEELLEGYLIQGYMVHFFYLDLTNTCLIQGIETPSANFLLICQAEDREFQTVQLVFKAMLASVLRNQKRENE